MQADYNDIYNLLFAGKSVRLEFASAKDAEHFRVRFAQFKSRQETTLQEIGAMEAADVLAFSFTREGTSCSWQAKFVRRRQPATFKILVVE